MVYSVCCNRVLRDAAVACHRALCAALEEFVHSHVLVLEAKGLTLGPDMPQILALADAWATYRKVRRGPTSSWARDRDEAGVEQLGGGGT